MAAQNIDQTVRSTFSRVAGGAAHTIAAEKLEEAIEQSIREFPADRVNNPEKLIDILVAMIAAVPVPIRTPLLHAFASAIEKDATGKVPELAKLLLPVALRATDTGADKLLHEQRIDRGALRGWFREQIRRDNPEGAPGAPAASGIHKPGTTGLRSEEGLRIAHVIGSTTCIAAQKPMQESGSAADILGRPGVVRCTVCYPDAVVPVTLKPPPAPAPTPQTVADILLADKAGDGHIGRALAVFSRITEMRSAELIDEPRRFWHLLLMHQDGVPRVPRALNLLPTISEAEETEFTAACDMIRVAHDGNLPTPAMAFTIVTVMVRRFDAYMAEIRLLAEQDVNDVWEWGARMVDMIDDRITGRQREWLLGVLRSRRPWIILGAIVLLYVLALLGSAAAGIAAWAMTFGFVMLTFGAGVVLFLFGFITILMGSGGLSLAAMYTGWACVIVSRLFMPLLDRVYQLARNAIRGVIPGYEEGWFGRLMRRGGDFARHRGWLPAAAVGTTPVVLVTNSWWLDTALVISVAACVVGVIGGLTYFGYHPAFSSAVVVMAMTLILLLLQAADIYKRLRHLLPWAEKEKDAITTKNVAIKVAKWGAFGFVGAVATLALSVVATGAISVWFGWDNVTAIQQQSRQEACEMAGTCEPEHYRNERLRYGYCDTYPNAPDCRRPARR